MYGNEQVNAIIMIDVLLSLVIVTIIGIITIILAMKQDKRFILRGILAYLINYFLLLILLPSVGITVEDIGFAAVVPKVEINVASYIIPLLSIIIQSIPLVMLIISKKKSKKEEGETKCQE